mgnify:CR=1 FL=1
MKNATKKPLKTVKKVIKKGKKVPKTIDLSGIPEKFPDGVAIPNWVREMYAQGTLPKTLIPPEEKSAEAPLPSADSRVQNAERQMPEETWQESAPMTDQEMATYLKEFYRSNVFKAYKQYINLRLQIVTNALHSTDPIKEPTQMARQQGIRLGLIDVEGFIISLLELEKKENEKNQQQ